MKTQRIFLSRRGFTLMELMVAMAITTIIVTVLVSITSIAIDTWNRSRAELRASRQAKAMVDTMAHDFESLVTRRGNDFEWLSAVSEPPTNSKNAVLLVFLSAITDRYNGDIGTPGVDLGGDVSCVGYKLDWKDPIGGGSTSKKLETFVLNRYRVDPRPTFDTLLGKSEIGNLFSTTYGSELEKEENFVCENIAQFTITFHVEVKPTGTGTGTSTTEHKLVSISPSGTGAVQRFSIKGSGIETTPANDDLKSGRITAVEISLSVLSDSGVVILGNAPAKADDPVWLAKNSYQYSKLVQLPGM
jgi:prepilin-type N-terminal cleavage/methylation domain-containing protein